MRNNNTTVEPDPHTTPPPRRILLQTANIGPAFWTVASLISLAINIILIVVVLVLGQQIFAIKKVVGDQLIGGLYQNFILMDQAHIRTSIPVKTNVPARFDLPLKTDTTVRLTQDTVIAGARVTLDGGYVTINSAPTNIILPAGTLLPVNLDLTVPVNQQIPVELMVEVDIPLNQTELHQPFTGLQAVVSPYYSILNQLPNTWVEVVCGKTADSFCNQFFH